MYEARGIRTPNLWVWNPTRCHCAIASVQHAIFRRIRCRACLLLIGVKRYAACNIISAGSTVIVYVPATDEIRV